MSNSQCSPQWRTERVIFRRCGYLNKNLTSLLKLNQIQLACHLHLYYFEICVPLWGNLETLKQEVKDEKRYLIPCCLTLHHSSLILLNLYPNLSVSQITELDFDDRGGDTWRQTCQTAIFLDSSFIFIKCKNKHIFSEAFFRFDVD